MNKENILFVADLIEKQPKTEIHSKSGFTMEFYVHDCGTPACIAGWAVAANRGMGGNDDIRSAAGEKSTIRTVSEEAREYLGIDEEVGEALFLGFESRIDLRKITPMQAVDVLRNLAETGEVDWQAVGYNVWWTPEMIADLDDKTESDESND